LHQRGYPLAPGPPIRELPPERPKGAAPQRGAPGTPTGSDLPLKIALGIVVVAILIVSIAVIVGIVSSLG
jgi:hypothetical protein